MAIDWERSWWLASGEATAAPRSHRPELFWGCRLEPRCCRGNKSFIADSKTCRLPRFTSVGAFKDCQKCPGLFLFLKTLTLCREWNPAEAALIVWGKSQTETVCTAAHGIHYNREREGSYGWEITHSHQTNAADCGLRSCRSHKQPNIIHRFYCSHGFNGKRNAGRHQQSLQSHLSRTVIKFYFITLLLFLSGLHRRVKRQALVQSAICQKRRWHPKSLLLFILQWSYQKEQEYSSEHPVMKDNLQLSASRSHRRHTCI